MINYIFFKEIQIEKLFNCSNISRYYCFYCIVDQINVALVSIRDFFLNLTEHLKCSFTYKLWCMISLTVVSFRWLVHLIYTGIGMFLAFAAWEGPVAFKETDSSDSSCKHNIDII